MTVIVGILNAKGCILASDSAQSNSYNNKITGVVPTAKKIFNLENKKIAAGIYGNSSYFHIPLQNIIGRFSKINSQTDFQSVKECKEAFLDYVATIDVDIHYMNFLKSVAISNISGQFDEEFKTNKNVGDVINKIYSILTLNWYSHPATPQYLTRYGSTLSEIKTSIEDFFKEKLPTYQMDVNQESAINNWIHMYHQQKNILLTNEANNVVFVGFGAEELLPSISDFSFSGKYFDDLQMTTHYEDTILGSWSSIIRPLADASEIWSYINGIHPTLMNELIDSGHLQIDRINTEYSTPFRVSIAGVNLQELGELGKSLVTITSLKKRFSNSDESVGGPVQLISIDLLNGCTHEIF